MGNELYKSPPSKDCTFSSLTSKDYVSLSGDLTPVYKDSMPVHQDLTPAHQDLMPVYQDFMPVCQDFMPVCQDSTPVYQDFAPASQDLPFIKDVCATPDSASWVYKPFNLQGLNLLLNNKVNKE